MSELKDIKSYNLKELKEELTKMGEKPFRAGQIYRWLHVETVRSFDEMTNISKSLREKLSREYEIRNVNQIQVLVSKIDGTRKYISEIKGGSVIESVLMRYHHGNSVCISTQSGCRMGCKFCASTLKGLDRNLTPSEMLDEIYSIERDINEKVSNIVLMGSGEPLDNFDNVTNVTAKMSDGKIVYLGGAVITSEDYNIAPGGYIQKELFFAVDSSDQDKIEKINIQNVKIGDDKKTVSINV